ncbi:MAG: Glycosyl transferase [Lachnoclostridium sp.]|jgi:glycosyltransferase involved in cell wall biosynthesis
MNRVNVIMTTYNGAQYIRPQIESIINGSYADYKLWIFDDGSTDDTVSVIYEFVKENPEKIIFHQNERKKGVTGNFLEGVRYAANINEQERKEQRSKFPETDEECFNIRDYYMFCDQDDVWMPDKISKTMIYMKKLERKFGQDHPLAVFTDAYVVDSKLNVLERSFHKSNHLDTKKVDLPHILMENKLIGCTMMFNEPVQKLMIKEPVHARYHDWWVALIAAAFGHIGYLPYPTLLYRQHGGNMVGNQSFHTYFKNRLKSLKEQKEAIRKNVLQAEEFYKIYKSMLGPEQKQQVYCMGHLLKENWIKRRQLVLKFGYLKTGLIRNLGLLYIL